jgi:hypothetical protein
MFLSDSDEGANVGEENGCTRGDMMNRCQACGCYCSVKELARGNMSYTEQGIYRDGGGIWKSASGWGLGLPRNVLWLVASGGDRVWGQKSAREASGRPLFFGSASTHPCGVSSARTARPSVRMERKVGRSVVCGDCLPLWWETPRSCSSMAAMSAFCCAPS